MMSNCTPAEFRRAMRHAFGDAVSDDAKGLLVDADGATLHFALSSEEARRIGALELSVLRVEITVRQGDEKAASELLARIDRATQRGGG
jgi:ribosomal protein S3